MEQTIKDQQAPPAEKPGKKIFNRALFISIPDEEPCSQDMNPNNNSNTNSNKEDIKYKPSSLNPTPSDSAYGDKFISKSLFKRLEEETPVNIQQITYDMNSLNLNTHINTSNNEFIQDNPELPDMNNPIGLTNNMMLNQDTQQQQMGMNMGMNVVYNNEMNSPNGVGVNHNNGVMMNQVMGVNVNVGNEQMMENHMEEEEYIFEKFGKRGWQCEKCNNFNFESRTKCNRCKINKMPKSLARIREDEIRENGERKKKPLIEREGDWLCTKCRNLNFAFRQSCNRCKLPKPQPQIQQQIQQQLQPQLQPQLQQTLNTYSQNNSNQNSMDNWNYMNNMMKMIQQQSPIQWGYNQNNNNNNSNIYAYHFNNNYRGFGSNGNNTNQNY